MESEVRSRKFTMPGEEEQRQRNRSGGGAGCGGSRACAPESARAARRFAQLGDFFELSLDALDDAQLRDAISGVDLDRRRR